MSKYDGFSVGYFPPYKKYYISNGRERYVSRRGIGNYVVYFNDYDTAKNLF